VDSNGNKVFDSTDELIGQLVGATALTSADIVWA
jgi:hypothetical protein